MLAIQSWRAWNSVMGDTEHMLSCKLNSSCECIHVLSSMVEVIGHRAGLSDKLTNRMVLAVDEMFANIAQHAYHGHEGKVDMAADWHEDMLSFELRDYADPLTGPEMESWSPVQQSGSDIKFGSDIKSGSDLKSDAELKPGGLGLHLMQAVMDRIEHEALADGNRWRLIKYLGPADLNGEHNHEA